MERDGVERRLAAILAVDMVGYSRLIQADEEGTLARLEALREELIDPSIARHGGRIVKTTGDGLLVEFGSVVDAVRNAVEVQRAMAARNAGVPEDRRIEFRVGVNLGDIVVQGEDILGDGVNIAARLEAAADPGGICIPRKVFDEVRDKLDVGFEFLGDQTFKNIEKPVPVYRVLLEAEAAGKVLGESRKAGGKGVWAVAAAALVVVIAGGLWWWQPWAPDVEPARIEKMAFPLPEKPSIAVLPFDNMSGDARDEVFSDGLTEDIITSLSKITTMFVIARNSTFTYKGKPVKVQRVAEELGVRYVLEGSVRRSGDRLRVTGQLIDATTGRHLWSERYDREVQEIFALQDEITKQIVSALEVKLTAGEWARVIASGTKNVKAWELVREGEIIHRRFTKEDNARARDMYKRAIELDPEYPAAWGYLGGTHHIDGRFRWSKSPKESFRQAIELSKKALSLDETLPGPHGILGQIYLFQRRHDEAIAEGERAVALSPNAAPSNAVLGFTLAFSGRPEEAIALLKKAMRLSPYYPDYMMWMLGLAYTEAGRYEEAAQVLKKSLERNPDHFLPHVRLAAALSELGRDAEAQAEAAEVLRTNPKFTIAYWGRVSPYKDPAAWARHRKALLGAGLPENPPLPLPDKPSIAVLPFTNMSGDTSQDYFADGMAEDIITDLSKISGLFVIARNSSFAYRGRQVDVRAIARELGVKYVLEGSVRRVGDQVRINAQLIDASTGGHLWAERYDGTLADVFALQDSVTERIVTALSVKLTIAEQTQAFRKETDSLEAYDALLIGLDHFRRKTPADYGKAISHFERAVGLDPDYGRAHAALAATYWGMYVNRWTRVVPMFEEVAGVFTEEAAIKRVKKHLKKAMYDPTPLAHRLASELHAINRRNREAIVEAASALAIDANDADSHVAMAAALVWAGRASEAVDHVEQAMRLDPHYPPSYLYVLGLANFEMGRLQEAATQFEIAMKRNPQDLETLIPLTAAYAVSGQVEQAKGAFNKYLEPKGGSVDTLGKGHASELGVRAYMRKLPFRNARSAKNLGDGLVKIGVCCQEDVEEFIDRMRKKGLLE